MSSRPAETTSEALRGEADWSGATGKVPENSAHPCQRTNHLLDGASWGNTEDRGIAAVELER